MEITKICSCSRNSRGNILEEKHHVRSDFEKMDTLLRNGFQEIALKSRVTPFIALMRQQEFLALVNVFILFSENDHVSVDKLSES